MKRNGVKSALDKLYKVESLLAKMMIDRVVFNSVVELKQSEREFIVVMRKAYRRAKKISDKMFKESGLESFKRGSQRE